MDESRHIKKESLLAALEQSLGVVTVACKKADVPIIADIHFHYKRALEAADAGAACLRVNPGNIQ